MSRPALVPVCALAIGCLPYSPMEDPPPPVEVPRSYSSGGEGGEGAGRAVSTEPWWRTFGDPGLDAVQTRALRGNFQVLAAWARLQQAQALAEQAGAPRWPQVSAELTASRSRNVMALPRVGTVAVQSNRFSASLPVAYEVDLFGRLGAEAAAADLDARAARDDVEAMAMTISAQVTEAWFNLVEARARRRLLEEQIRINETFLGLVELRFQQGIASAVDVYQQRQQLGGTRIRLTSLEAQEAVLANQLAVLAGQPPVGAPPQVPEEIPDLPPLPGAGVPSELLRNRPDIRSAQRRVESADQRVGAAIADRFPTLRLTGSVGFSAGDLADLLDSFVWSIAGSVSQSVFDGGRRGAEVDRREAVVRERLYAYADTVLRALLEVENALGQETREARRIEQLEEQVTLASDTLREARTRYREGLTDFLPVLTALASLQGAELELLAAKRQVVSHRVQLHRALGGTWTQELVDPEPDGPRAGTGGEEEDEG